MSFATFINLQGEFDRDIYIRKDLIVMVEPSLTDDDKTLVYTADGGKYHTTMSLVDLITKIETELP